MDAQLMNIGILLLGMIGLLLGSDSFIKGITAAANTFLVLRPNATRMANGA